LILSNIKECEEITTVGITGGEPMLYQDLVEYIFDYNFDRNMKSEFFWLVVTPAQFLSFLL